MASAILALTAWTFLILIVLMLIKVPISFALGIASLGGVLMAGNLPVMVIAQRMFYGLDSFTLIAVPLFILAGALMALGGVSRDLMNLSNVLVGWMRGGMSYVTIVASMIFAGITGTASSDASSIGGIMIPTMIKRGYDRDFTVAVTATSATIGIMIPPSVPMVLYGTASGTSIGKLFLGGVVPGLLVGGALMLVAGFTARKRGYPAEKRVSFKESFIIFIKSIPALGTVAIIIGGIVSGVFTPTEAAGIACLYTSLLGIFYYKELKLTDLPRLVYESSKTMGIVALMIAAATALGWFFTSQGVPKLIASTILSMTDNRVVILLLVNLVLLFVGMWMDLAPAVTLFTPILLPVVMQVGIEPVHFGIIMVVNLAIGLFTPPVGVCLFITCGMAKISIADSIRAFIPFFLAMVAILMLITFVPSVAMFLPNLFYK